MTSYKAKTGGSRLAGGGLVDPRLGPPGRDTIPAEVAGRGTVRLDGGEYVLPRDTTRKVGKSALDKLVAQTHTPVRPPRSGKPGLANGGWFKGVPQDRAAQIDAQVEQAVNPPPAPQPKPAAEPAGQSLADVMREIRAKHPPRRYADGGLVPDALPKPKNRFEEWVFGQQRAPREPVKVNIGQALTDAIVPQATQDKYAEINRQREQATRSKPGPGTVDPRLAGGGGGPAAGPDTMPIDTKAPLPPAVGGAGTASIQREGKPAAGRPTSMGIARTPTASEPYNPVRALQEYQNVFGTPAKREPYTGPSGATMYERRLKERELGMLGTPYQIGGSWAKGRVEAEALAHERQAEYRKMNAALDAGFNPAGRGSRYSEPKQAQTGIDALDLAKFVADRQDAQAAAAREESKNARTEQKDLQKLTADSIDQSSKTGFLSTLPDKLIPYGANMYSTLIQAAENPYQVEALLQSAYNTVLAKGKVDPKDMTEEDLQAVLQTAGTEVMRAIQ